MSNMCNFDQVILGNHAVKDLEPKLTDNLPVNAVNSRQLCALGCRRMNSTAA